MSDSLATYLHDHLAGSQFALKLLDSLQEQYRGQPLGLFAEQLHGEIQQDQDVLKEIIQRVGSTHLDLTEATGWLAEKASQLKLKDDHASGGLGTFEALETLTLGIRGKLGLWHAIQAVREYDSRVPEYDFWRLASRAEDQFARAEQQRLGLVRTTFSPKAA